MKESLPFDRRSYSLLDQYIKYEIFYLVLPQKTHVQHDVNTSAFECQKRVTYFSKIEKAPKYLSQVRSLRKRSGPLSYNKWGRPFTLPLIRRSRLRRRDSSSMGVLVG